MVVPLIPILIGAGIRLAAPTVAKFLMKKGFKKASQKALTKAGNNAKSINKSQATKLKPPKVARSKKSPTPSSQTPVKPELTKEMMVRAVSNKPKLRSPTPSKQVPSGGKQVPSGGKNVPARIKSPTSSRQVPSGGKNVPAKRSNTNLTKKPESKMKLALNKNKKTSKLRDGIIPTSMAAIVVGDTLRNKKSNNNTGTATAKTNNVLSKKRNKDNRLPPGAFGGQVTSTAKPPKKIDPTAGNKIRKDRKIPKGALDASGDVSSSPFGPIETKARNRFIKKSGGKDAFKSDKQIDSLFVNEMLDMREGSEGNSGFGLDDQNTYEAILEERKSKKAGGKVSKKKGGMIKRNMGGKVTPRKKTVFRRGGGKALRGMGKATYSNKMY